MTYSRLLREMPTQEMELWKGLAMLRAEECPNCGVHGRDFMGWDAVPVKCPVCKTQYTRVKQRAPSR